MSNSKIVHTELRSIDESLMVVDNFDSNVRIGIGMDRCWRTQIRVTPIIILAISHATAPWSLLLSFQFDTAA